LSLEQPVKLDTDLCRSILLQMEAADVGGDEIIEVRVDGHSPAEINYHLRALSEAGLVRCYEIPDSDSDAPTHFAPVAVTWDGHQFLDKTRDNGIWAKAKELALAKTGGIALAVVSAAAEHFCLKELGFSA
jgi:hypothetical protein